jgi:hypothetical protein
LVYTVAPVGGQPFAGTDSEQIMHWVLNNGRTWSHPQYAAADILSIQAVLRDDLQKRFTGMHEEFSARNNTLASIQRAQIESHFTRRNELDERRLATLRERGRSEKAIKLVQSHLDKNMELGNKRLRDLERTSSINFSFEEVAAGVFRVEK